jgi:hypothetical protein
MYAEYIGSQKEVLIEEVGFLTKKLGRPVCSKDLLERWRAMPEKRPLLSQAVGQLLLKASRPNRRGYPTLFQIGVIGYLAYYAADNSPGWISSLRQHEIVLSATAHVRWGIPEQAAFLLGTEFDASARNALAGFIAEWGPIAGNCSVTLPDRLLELLEIARRESPGSFSGQCPELIGREEARVVIAEELKIRNPFFAGDVNWKRHLATLCWPMSSLFTQTGYCENQVRLYCAARWPVEEDPMEAKALWLCGVYGLFG